MADSKHALKFLEGGVRMRFNVDLEFLRVEFAPVAPAFLGSQRSGLRGGQIAVNRPPPKIKTPGGLDFGPTLVDELHHPFPQIQRIGFHAQKPVRLCANVNMNCSSDGGFGLQALQRVAPAQLLTSFCDASSDALDGRVEDAASRGGNIQHRTPNIE